MAGTERNLPVKIENVLVVGAGVMGHGIAQCFAQTGHRVALVDTSQAALDRAAVLARSGLETLASEGLLPHDRPADAFARITFSTDLPSAARDADLAIEAVVEDGAIKKSLFAQLDRCCPPKSILASNTTALNIFELVETTRPDRVMICHWYTPPQVIPLVDVVKGPETSAESVSIVVETLRRMGKQPIVMNKFVNGYVVPRLQMALNREIFYLLDNGYITPEDLDEAAKAGLALRMLVVGVVQRMDFGGLDLTVRGLNNPDVQGQMAPADYRPTRIFDLVSQGNLGVKTGRGFYDYAGQTEAEIYRERDRRLIQVLKTYELLRQESDPGT